MIETTLGEHARFWRTNEARARRALAARENVLRAKGATDDAIAHDREMIECGLDVEFARQKAYEIDLALRDVRVLRDALRASDLVVPPLPPVHNGSALIKGES